MYVGKAAGQKGLKGRLRQLIDFGFGKCIGHRGGRLLWHLEDSENFVGSLADMLCGRSGSG